MSKKNRAEGGIPDEQECAAQHAAQFCYEASDQPLPWFAQGDLCEMLVDIGVSLVVGKASCRNNQSLRQQHDACSSAPTTQKGVERSEVPSAPSLHWYRRAGTPRERASPLFVKNSAQDTLRASPRMHQHNIQHTWPKTICSAMGQVKDTWVCF